MVYSSFLVFFSRSYLQAFRRAGMPQPLDVWRWDSVGCAVKCLSAPSWHWTRVLQRHCFLPYLRTHCQMRKPTNTQAHAHTHTRAKFNHWGELKTEQKWVDGWRIEPELLTIDHKSECEILEESVFLDSYKDSVPPSILLCYVPDHQGVSFHVVSGALLRCHLAVLQPVRGEKKEDSKQSLVRRVEIISKSFFSINFKSFT